MNVLFISISSFPHVSEHGISLDLLHEFKRQGHNVYIVCAIEKRDNKKTNISKENGYQILRVRIGNNKGINIIEKGVTTVMLPKKYIAAIKKFFADVRFDLILYPTPPITQVKTVEYIKKRDGAKSYLLLKDIFPQNAVDIGMMSKSGVRGGLYRYFRKLEKKLYMISDYIGCMSEANVEYILKHNPEIIPNRVGVCPNSIEVIDKSVDEEIRQKIRIKYGIPLKKKIFIYGGNLGRPQGIPFVIECLKKMANVDEVYFLIIGDGSEYGVLEEYVRISNQNNIRLIKKLPKEEYDIIVAACDIGLIFLDYRFTIPNFPSRLLGYMQARIPVFAVTDPNTDIGKIIMEGGFGWWCESNNSEKVVNMIKEIALVNKTKLNEMKSKEWDYLINNYNVQICYQKILDSFIN